MTFMDVIQERYLRVSAIDAFVASGGDVNYRDMNPVQIPFVVPTVPGRSLLHHAALRQQTAIVRYLLKLGADPNIADCRGRTPLHEAVEIEFIVATESSRLPTTIPSAEALMELGADDQIADGDGWRPRDLLLNIEECNRVYDAIKDRASRKQSHT